MIKAFDESKLDKAIEQTANYCRDYNQAKDADYLKLLKKIKKHANSKTSTNFLILKDKVSINNRTNISRLGIDVEDIQVKSRNWVGGYVSKYVDGYTIKGIILRLKKTAPSHYATNG
jgi:hypothetical protein